MKDYRGQLTAGLWGRLNGRAPPPHYAEKKQVLLSQNRRLNPLLYLVYKTTRFVSLSSENCSNYKQVAFLSKALRRVYLVLNNNLDVYSEFSYAGYSKCQEWSRNDSDIKRVYKAMLICGRDNDYTTLVPNDFQPTYNKFIYILFYRRNHH